MSPYRAFLTLGTLAMSLGVSDAARASEVGLSFELPPSPQQKAAAAAAAEAAKAPPEPPPVSQALVSADAPLPVPAGAEAPPMAGDQARPAGVYGGLDAVAIGATQSVSALLPPPPQIPEYLVQPAIAEAPTPPPETAAEAVASADTTAEQKEPEKIGFWVEFKERTFDPPEPIAAEVPEPVKAQTFQYSFDNFSAMFEGGTDSLVARAVGSAEGTRTPEGHKNPAYYGHVDPGNGVWNLGTFSYQHGAASPEEADDKQLRRLQSQTEKLRAKAVTHGLQLSQEELLNGIDLANQAPLAALDRGGYIEWLKEAHRLGMQGSEAIVWARTRSFIDPDTQRWNAPGLGNNVYSISHDQERRANAIARAVSAFNTQTQIAIAPAPTPAGEPPTASAVDDSVGSALEQPQDKLPFTLTAFSDADRGKDRAIAQTQTTTAPKSNQDVPDAEPQRLAQAPTPKRMPFGLGLRAFMPQPEEPTSKVPQGSETTGLNRLASRWLERLDRSPQLTEQSVSSTSTTSTETGEAESTNLPNAKPTTLAETPTDNSSVTEVPTTEATASTDVLFGAFATPRIWSPDESDDPEAIADDDLWRELLDDAVPAEQAPAASADENGDLAVAEDVKVETQTTATEEMRRSSLAVNAAPLAAVVLPNFPVAAEESQPDTAIKNVDSALPTSATQTKTSDLPILDPRQSATEAEQTKASAYETDADSIKQQTLDALELLQQQLRQVTED